jgi:serine protease Do
VAVLLAGCGGGGGSAISSIDNAKDGVIRIVATGSFQDPEVGLQLNAAGSGSGFIIDPSGIAVTNNHVVTGAATLEVYVGGSATPVNARVLGVSECADLAVIDLEGEGYPYFEWYPDDVAVNLDVRSAGFPLGTSEFTLTRGIVSQARADGETPWASVDSVLEHDARINPGNSGGPLLDDNARVVGVNYAGDASTARYFSIAAPLARRVVEQLAEGKSVQAIGINGRAVFDEESEVAGIWVASVESGSPASKAGIEGGDVITRLEDLVLATDGTLKTYCDVLQTKGSERVLKVEVLRYATQEVLEGELNGKPLEQSFSFAQEYGDQVAEGSAGGAFAYDSYVEVSDDSGLLTLEVPASWVDVNGSANQAGNPALSASPSLQGYINSWDVPGLLFVAGSDLAAMSDAEVLDMFSSDAACESQGREPYQDPLYTGTLEFFGSCGGTGTARVLVVARPPENTFAAVIDMQLVSDADLAALDQVMRTFIVNTD